MTESKESQVQIYLSKLPFAPEHNRLPPLQRTIRASPAFLHLVSLVRRHARVLLQKDGVQDPVPCTYLQVLHGQNLGEVVVGPHFAGNACSGETNESTMASNVAKVGTSRNTHHPQLYPSTVACLQLCRWPTTRMMGPTITS